MSIKLAELLIAIGLYVVLVGASVLMGAADLAGLAFFTILPLGLLLGVRRDLSVRQKLAKVELLWYVLPFVGFAIWTTNHPGQTLYFLVGTLCGMIFFVCFACLMKLYWFERR